MPGVNPQQEKYQHGEVDLRSFFSPEAMAYRRAFLYPEVVRGIPQEPIRLLDIGCGGGGNALQRTGHRLRGIGDHLGRL